MTTFNMQCLFFFSKGRERKFYEFACCKAVTVIETFKSMVCRVAAYLLFMYI